MQNDNIIDKENDQHDTLNLNINDNNPNIKNNDLKLINLKKIFKIININISTLKDIENIEIERNTLLNEKINNDFNKLLEECKDIYSSSKLTSLHNNRELKQKFPGINLLRQILKCNNLKLTPKITSYGYNKNNGKKIIKRSFIINNINEV